MKHPAPATSLAAILATERVDGGGAPCGFQYYRAALDAESLVEQPVNHLTFLTAKDAASFVAIIVFLYSALMFAFAAVDNRHDKHVENTISKGSKQ